MDKRYDLNRLLDSRFHVDSVKYTGPEGLQYLCRDLPHSTVIDLLSHVFEAMNDKEALDQLNRFAMSSTDGTQQDIENLLGSLLPMLRRLCVRGSSLVEHILCDVVVNITPDQAHYVPVEDALTILEKSIDRVDTPTLAKTIRNVFSNVVQIGAEVPPPETEQPPPLSAHSGPQASSSTQPAQDSLSSSE